MGFSNDPYLLERQWNSDVSGRGKVVAADAGPVTLVALKTGWTTYVQRVHIHITTSVAQTATFKDSNGTPITIGVTDSAPGADAEYHWDFGPMGVALTEAKDFVLALSSTGLAFSYYFEAFRKQTGVERVNSGIGVPTGTGQQFS